MIKKTCIIVVACLLILLTSCVVTPERSYVAQEITYSEPNAQCSFRIKMDIPETETAKYYFDPVIENAERESCIKATEIILSNQSLNGIIPEIYIFSKDRYDSKYITEHKLYTSIEDWKSVDYATDILLTVYGESAHYGAVFGYANYICKANHWKNTIDGNFSQPSAVDIYDLNLLCFDKKFAAADDICAAQKLSCDFANWYINNYGETTFQQFLRSSNTSFGMQTVKNELKSYYLNYGISYDPSVNRYGYGGNSYDYIVFSDLATFYIENGWIDTNSQCNPLISDGFLHSNYAETKLFFEINLQQMQLYQNLFALEKYNNDLSIVFSITKNLSNYSFYQKANHRIYVYNVDSLMHEYIHALTMPDSSMEKWKTEGFARYFSYYYDYYGVAFLNQDYNNTPNSSATKYVHEYLAYIHRPIDISVDYTELENIAVYSRGYTNPNSSYVAGSSFIQYLVDQYGENAVADYIYGSGTPLPKTYDELVQGWVSYIDNNYSAYSKYTK